MTKKLLIAISVPALFLACMQTSFAQTVQTEQTQQSGQAAQTQQTQQPTAKPAGTITAYPTYPNAIEPYKLLFEIKPGQTVEDFVTLKNLTADTTYKVATYAVDSTKTVQGDLAYKLSSDKQENAGLWIQMEQPFVMLQPGEEKKLKVSIAIPENAKEGDYIGGLAFETSSQGNISGITIAMRLMVAAKIKVTNNPQHIAKIGEIDYFSPRPVFWGSSIIFLGSIWYFIRVGRKEKHAKSK
jgi:uncharacterized membrane protein